MTPCSMDEFKNKIPNANVSRPPAAGLPEGSPWSGFCHQAGLWAAPHLFIDAATYAPSSTLNTLNSIITEQETNLNSSFYLVKIKNQS